MLFRIADTFLDSLAKLQPQEQKAAKLTAFDLQANPENPGHSFHKLDRAKDKNFWSVRVNRDIRIIVHRTAKALLICFVGHHDDAYDWAERRRLETHPKTGAAQLVELQERIEQIAVPGTPEPMVATPSGPPVLAYLTRDELLDCGVPEDWIDVVQAADDDDLLDIATRLPQEAAEALLTLATGGTPEASVPAEVGLDPFEHPDAQRRFRVVDHVEELERALEYSWEKWTVFLHPAQRRFVERSYTGPARISGSAGTGKTIVALHRAVHLARTNPDARVLLTSFSEPLARSLSQKRDRLIGNEPGVTKRVVVKTLNETGAELYYRLKRTEPRTVEPAELNKLVEDCAAEVDISGFAPRFLIEEWRTVVDARQLTSLESYAEAPRLGRKTRLGPKQRQAAWRVFETVNRALNAKGWLSWSALFHELAEAISVGGKVPYTFAVVDEAQDLTIGQLRFLAAFGGERPDGLFFAGDLGQRIFQQPFSWKALGVDIRGRSHTLRTNYRTSHQIRRQADRLLPDALADVDGNAESRLATVSVFNGPEPQVATFATEGQEGSAVSAWLKALVAESYKPGEIGVIVRTPEQLLRAEAAITAAGLSVSTDVNADGSSVAVRTMHLAKGLEFRAVAVMACDDEVIPLQSRVEEIADESDLEEVYNTERHLLYVACTRARDRLLVTGVEPASEFLSDLSPNFPPF